MGGMEGMGGMDDDDDVDLGGDKDDVSQTEYPPPSPHKG